MQFTQTVQKRLRFSMIPRNQTVHRERSLSIRCKYSSLTWSEQRINIRTYYSTIGLATTKYRILYLGFRVEFFISIVLSIWLKLSTEHSLGHVWRRDYVGGTCIARLLSYVKWTLGIITSLLM